jgi:hypothetical protein
MGAYGPSSGRGASVGGNLNTIDFSRIQNSFLLRKIFTSNTLLYKKSLKVKLLLGELHIKLSLSVMGHGVPKPCLLHLKKRRFLNMFSQKFSNNFFRNQCLFKVKAILRLCLGKIWLESLPRGRVKP